MTKIQKQSTLFGIILVAIFFLTSTHVWAQGKGRIKKFRIEWQRITDSGRAEIKNGGLEKGYNLFEMNLPVAVLTSPVRVPEY